MDTYVFILISILTFNTEHYYKKTEYEFINAKKRHVLLRSSANIFSNICTHLYETPFSSSCMLLSVRVDLSDRLF